MCPDRVPHVSTLWTPGGEREVPRPDDADDTGGLDPLDDDLDDLDELDDLEDLDPEQLAAVQAQMAEARRQLASVPAAQVIANHAIGFYELGAIHLSQQPPNLAEAALAIDAMATVVEGLGDRLGDTAPTLRDALAQIRLAYVSVRSSVAS